MLVPVMRPDSQQVSLDEIPTTYMDLLEFSDFEPRTFEQSVFEEIRGLGRLTREVSFRLVYHDMRYMLTKAIPVAGLDVSPAESRTVQY